MKAENKLAAALEHIIREGINDQTLALAVAALEEFRLDRALLARRSEAYRLVAGMTTAGLDLPETYTGIDMDSDEIADDASTAINADGAYAAHKAYVAYAAAHESIARAAINTAGLNPSETDTGE